MASLEEQRDQRVARNKRRLDELGIRNATEQLRSGGAVKKPRQPKQASQQAGAAAAAEPPRRSGRQRAEVSYAEPSMQDLLDQAAAAATAPRGGAQEREPLPEYAPRATPVVPITPSFDPSDGRRDARGRLVFEGHPDFRPNLTPQQVIRAGSFGGIYFNPRGGKPGILGREVAVDHREFPPEWFKGLPRKAYAARVYTVGRNKYGVKAGQDQAFWEEKGWIDPQDPRGWFQWYCRFFQGRRTDGDARQISRWKGVIGDKGRWVRALVNKIIRSNKRWDDSSVSPVIRQTLLHWAFELTEDEFRRMMEQL